MIRIKSQNDNFLTFDISSYDKNVNVWLECQYPNDTSTFRLKADRVKDSSSNSICEVGVCLPEGCRCLVHREDGHSHELYGMLIKENGQWFCTDEYSDFSIDYISFSLTEQCNMHCNMCWQNKNKDSGFQVQPYIELEDFLLILKKISILSTKKVFLWGGEPLLHPQINEIISAIKNQKKLCNLITNGLLLEDKADILLSNKLDSICVSIDGLDNIHDTIRGVPGAYKKIIQGLNYLNKNRTNRPIISINLVINQYNYHNLYETISEFYKFNVNGIQIQYPVFFPRETGMESAKKFKQATGMDITYWNGFVCDIASQNENIDTQIISEQIKKIKNDYPKTYFYPIDTEPSTWFTEKNNPRAIKCKTAWKRLNIDPKGNIVICNDHADMIAGNLLTNDFQSIWNNEVFRSFRRMMRKTNYMEMCQYCTYSYL